MTKQQMAGGASMFVAGLTVGAALVMLLWTASDAPKASTVGAAPSRNAVVWHHVGGR